MPSPTRVLHLLPDFDLGGGQMILMRTIAALRDPGWEHHVVAFDDGPLLDAYRAAGIRCDVIGDGRATGWPRSFVRLLALVRRERPDLMLSLNTPLDRTQAQLCSSITRRPVVVWFMSVAIPLIPFPPPRDRLLAFGKRLLLWPFNAVSIRRLAARIATSEAVARSFAEHLHVAPDRFQIAPPGLPDDAFDRELPDAERDALRSSLGIGGAWPVLLNVGMLIPLKGQLHLVEMMELIAGDLPRAHLLLVGEGPDRAALEERVAASPVGDRIRLLGHRHDVPDLLAVSDGVISASRSEGFGMSVLEAMAASLPVVAVRTPAFLEFVREGETALLVDAQDGSQLADAVGTVFTEPGRAAAMGAAGRDRAEDFRVGRRAAALGELLRRVSGPGPAPAGPGTS